MVIKFRKEPWSVYFKWLEKKGRVESWFSCRVNMETNSTPSGRGR